MRLFHAIILLLWATPLWAEPELHVIGVYEGATETDGRIHGPEVRVRLDRPGAEVALLLTSYEALRWIVEVAPGTTLSEVYLGGYQAQSAELIVDGTPTGAQALDMQSTYRVEGPRFRLLIESIPGLTGHELPTTFFGSYRPEGLIEIGPEAGPLPQFDPDYLAADLRPDLLTPALATLLETRPDPAVQFTDEGFAVRDADGSWSNTPVNLDVPRISRPVAGAFDPVRDVLWGVSVGGEGFLYRYDRLAAAWSVARSMEHEDAHGMILDPGGDRLIIVLGNGWEVAPVFEIMALETGEITRLDARSAVFPGIDDLWEPGNGPEPALVPLGLDGQRLMLSAQAPRSFQLETPERVYVVDLETGEAGLVAYSNP